MCSKEVLYTSPFIPAEWIAAHGLTPKRVMPRGPDGSPSAWAAVPGTGVCPYARAFLEEIGRSGGEAAIFTTACDQMRRLAERAPGQTFLMHVPTTRETVEAQRLYRTEVERLGRFLVDVGGRTPSPAHLAEVMDTWDTWRTTIINKRAGASPQSLCQTLTCSTPEQPLALEAGRAPERQAARVALVGPPLLHSHLGLFDLLQEAGAWVALDGTGTGERALPARFDRRRLHQGPFEELCGAHFGVIPDAFQRPNYPLYQWLERRFEEAGVHGAVFMSYVWCDTWRAEAQRLKEWSPVPVLILDSDGEFDTARIRGRIDAFVEVIG